MSIAELAHLVGPPEALHGRGLRRGPWCSISGGGLAPRSAQRRAVLRRSPRGRGRRRPHRVPGRGPHRSPTGRSPTGRRAPAAPWPRPGSRPSSACCWPSTTRPAFAAAFWGAAKLGAVAVPVNTLMGEAEYEFLLERQPRPGGHRRGRGGAARARRPGPLPVAADRAGGRRSGGRGNRLRRGAGPGQAAGGGRAHDRRGHRVLGLHLRLDRAAQGGRPHPPGTSWRPPSWSAPTSSASAPTT